ncbi:MAG: hypothetical protein IAI50_03485 [Candidatus Eremiobacteraeota bacterium]|nr:hypothetical protein [Candidatus Eremiobacteraeota bacterium]
MSELNPLDLEPETARVTEADRAAKGTRKPASDEVDSSRAAAARSEEESAVDSDPK